MYVCRCTCMSQKNINSIAYWLLNFTFFLLVSMYIVMFTKNKEFSLKFKNFSSLRNKFFYDNLETIIKKYTHYFTWNK